MHSVSLALSASLPSIHPGSLSACSKPFSYALSLCLCGGITLSFVIICLLIASFKAVHMLQQKQSCRIPWPRALQHNPTPNREAGNYSNELQHTVHCCTERKDSPHTHQRVQGYTQRKQELFFSFFFFFCCGVQQNRLHNNVYCCRCIHNQT